MTAARHHPCHALGCDRQIPPRLHMCPDHWRMVPRAQQRALWAEYVTGQERTMTPSAAYLHAAAQCVTAVANREGYTAEQIEAEIAPYYAWADMLTEDAEVAP